MHLHLLIQLGKDDLELLVNGLVSITQWRSRPCNLSSWSRVLLLYALGAEP
jgi:hypothetical protein